MRSILSCRTGKIYGLSCVLQHKYKKTQRKWVETAKANIQLSRKHVRKKHAVQLTTSGIQHKGCESYLMFLWLH